MKRVVMITGSTRGIGLEGQANFSAYCASKFGVIGLTQVVADETKESDLHMYAVLPGAVNTTLVSDSGLDLDPAELLAPEYLAGRYLKLPEAKENPARSLKPIREVKADESE